MLRAVYRAAGVLSQLKLQPERIIGRVVAVHPGGGMICSSHLGVVEAIQA
ncbi:MAG: hypothetical protein ACXQTL_07145 [Methanosarcinales archaeon]